MKGNITMKHVNFTLQNRLRDQLSKNMRKVDMLIKTNSTNNPETCNQVNSIMKYCNILAQVSFTTMKGGLGF